MYIRSPCFRDSVHVSLTLGAVPSIESNRERQREIESWVMQCRQRNDNRQREWEQSYYDDSELQCRHSDTHLWDFCSGSSPERSTNAEEDVVRLEKEQKTTTSTAEYENSNVQRCGMKVREKIYLTNMSASKMFLWIMY